jgi:hypothetical protein
MLLALTSKPWASMKSFDQRIFDMMSSNPTNAALVELGVLTFCFIEMESADGTRAKSHNGSNVTFHVLVDGKGGINMPFDHTGIIGTHALDIIFCSFKIVHHLYKLLPISFIGFSNPCHHKRDGWLNILMTMLS